MPLPAYREIETSISLANIKDQVAALLYAAGMVHDNEDILDIEFNGWKRGVDNIGLKIKLKKHQPVDIITHE